jgi:hypothetical protein
MEHASRAWAHRLTVAVALVVALLAAALPATAAPSTKNYTASLTFGGVTGTSVTVPFGEDSDVRLTLTNRPDSQQSFASAELTFSGDSLATAVLAPDGWTVQQLSASRWQVLDTGTSNAIVPGASLVVTVTMPGTPPGLTTLKTRVKQSNDFKGTNNDFANNTGDLTIRTEAPDGTDCLVTTCEETFPSSSINGVRADLTITSSSVFGYTAGFTTDRLSCDEIPFGPTVTPEPFQVFTDSTSPVSKTLVLTFPKALSNLVPDNGTPRHPVCAGGDYPFPGSSTVGVITHPYEGLLLNCSAPAYAAAIAGFEEDGVEFLPMCVAARSRSAGKLIVTVSIQSTTVDPRIW